ncbi:hypothetical protein MIND_00796700 [Mycena indigotica]|uniref:F-box domain-containing protein n=1 Tax=Mycena indigotica TaxID=2126181 RepID=A0A8H6SMD9_9AGAR|nr:uncharacterized protein MIND_00796700 [Mycena indigotica]KAF7302293.1 hypothetical protein MIND_00796700 [Mycena indigotica]
MSSPNLLFVTVTPIFFRPVNDNHSLPAIACFVFCLCFQYLPDTTPFTTLMNSLVDIGMELPLGLESLYEQLSQAQQSQISGLLREGLADEAELEHELDAVLSFVRDLQDLLGRRKNNNYVLASLNFLSPIRRLPVEIMAEIFEQCVLVDSAKLDYFPTNSQLKWRHFSC